jgi:hypothetical protein
MLFLMNNFVLQLDDHEDAPVDVVNSFHSLSLDFVSRLGAEIFAKQPTMPAYEPERAKRLARLINSKSPAINAALFFAQRSGVAPEEVAVRYADVSFEVMAVLFDRQRCGGLTTVEADRLVWRRLAA